MEGAKGGMRERDVNYGELISVVIPAYNRDRTIARAVAGVRAQTYPNLEIVVVDDASTDGTAERVAGLGDPLVRLVRHERNRGAAAARNTGVEHARGAWIAFQDSDDDWLPEKLARQAAHLAGLSGDHTITGGDLHPRLLEGNIIGPQTTLIAKAAFRAAGGFDTRLRNNEDWDFFLRLSERGKIGFLDDPLVVVMASDDSISRNDRFKVFSFVRIFGKIRRKTDDRRVLSRLASAVSSKLRTARRPRFERRYLAKAIRWNPVQLTPYLKYVRSLVWPV